MITHTNSINSIPTEEQETVINYSRMEKAVSIFTSDQTVITRLDKLCEKAPEYYQVTEVTISNVTNRVLTKVYSVSDKSVISYRPGKRKLSEEQKKAIAEQLRNGRENK